MNDPSPDGSLTWENFLYVIDFLESSHERHISLLGGEPTLNPHFVDFVAYLIARQFHVSVFTSGIMSTPVLDDAWKHLRDVAPDQLSFVVNVNQPDISSDKETERLERFLELFGHHSSLGYNIYRPDFDLAVLFDYINRYGTRRHLRIGLAHPIPGEHNRCLASHELKHMAQRLMQFVPNLDQFHITIGFDCGMPLCLFSDEQLGILYRISQGNLHFNCGPAIDIGPDLTVWSCFPLSGFRRRSLYDFNSLQDIRQFYERLHKLVRQESGGVRLECDTCRHRESGLCEGGCIAHLVDRFHTEAPVRITEVYG